MFKVGAQRSRSYFHTVGKRCRQYKELTLISRIIQLGTIDHHKRKMPIVRSEVKVRVSFRKALAV